MCFDVVLVLLNGVSMFSMLFIDFKWRFDVCSMFVRYISMLSMFPNGVSMFFDVSLCFSIFSMFFNGVSMFFDVSRCFSMFFDVFQWCVDVLSMFLDVFQCVSMLFTCFSMVCSMFFDVFDVSCPCLRLRL
jgi:hypothetical protein